MAPPKLTINKTIKFIRLYREQECLWQTETIQYWKKQTNDTALLKIKEGMGIDDLMVEDIKK